MAILYGGTSPTRLREVYKSDVKNTAILSPNEDSTPGSPIVITYVLESDKGTAAALLEVLYSTDGSSWSTCTADTSHASHEGTTDLSASADGTTHTYVWKAIDDLGASFNSTVYVKMRAQDGTYYDDYIQSDLLSVNLTPIVTISAPAGGAHGDSIDIDYSISTRVSGLTFSIDAMYSTDGGTSWADCTADTSDPDHDGTTSLSSGVHTFVWDTDTDLGVSYSGSNVMVRVRGNNGSADGEWATSNTFTIDMIPSVSITTPEASQSYGSPLTISYTITSLRNIDSFTLTAKYRKGGETTYNTCTEYTSGSDGTTSLTQGAHVFLWDSGTDLTTAYQSNDVQIELMVNDGTNDSSYVLSPVFEIDMLPKAPTLVSPFDTYFDIGDGAEFQWYIPTDPGSDKIHFEFIIADSITGTSVIDHNTADNPSPFDHYIDTATGLKNGASGITYYVRDLTVSSLTGTAVTFSSLTDHYKNSSLASTLTNPKIILVNKADREAYIPSSSITSTGFTIYKRTYGGSDDALVDLIIYTGEASAFETYWVDMTITGDTTLTFGTAPLDTDDLGNTIPSTITKCRAELLEGSDQSVYIYSSTDSGVVIKKSSYGPGGDAQVTLMLRSTPSDTYQQVNYDISPSGGQSTIIYNDAFTDNTNGSTAWPEYIPGIIMTTAPRADRHTYISAAYSDEILIQKCGFGNNVSAYTDLIATGELDSSVPYWNDVSPRGVPDAYENELAKYTVSTEDDLADGTYTWQVKAGNSTS